MLESNVIPMRRGNRQMGSLWTDFRNSTENLITGSANNAFPSTTNVSTAPVVATPAPMTIAGLSLTTVGILAVGGLVVWKILNRKK